MAYTVKHQRKDGSVQVTRNFNGVPYIVRDDRESALDKFPCNPMSGRTAEEARRNIQESLAETRRNLKDRKGFNDSKTARLVGQIPAEVFSHVMRNEGAEAARDTRYLMKVARNKFGIDCRVSRGRF